MFGDEGANKAGIAQGHAFVGGQGGGGGLMFGDAAPNAVGVVTGHSFTGGQGGSGGIIFGDSAPYETGVVFTPGGGPVGDLYDIYHYFCGKG